MWHSLGKVTATAGTPARATVNQTDPTARFPCHAILFQALSTNTGKVYVMEANVAFSASTYTKCLAVIAVPTANSLPSASATVTYAPAAFNAADFYIDVQTTGEGCLVSAVKS